ncbi:MAG TPA: proteoliaisin, partial [Archangium sp.]|nr:proteoliaisin [Archangium sp.]
ACGTCDNTCTKSQLSKATGTISIATGGWDMKDGDTFTLNDGLNVPVTFEFDKNANTGTGRIAVTISTGSSAEQVATAIWTAIQGVSGSGLDITAAVSTDTVTLTHGQAGSFGNQRIVKTASNASSTNNNLLVSGMSGGGGFDCQAGVACASSQDCEPGLVCTGGTCKTP